MLELALTYKKYPNIDIDSVIKIRRSHEIATDIVEKALLRIRSKETTDELIGEISSYALRNDSETLAEALKDYKINGYKGATLTVQIIKILKEIK